MIRYLANVVTETKVEDLDNSLFYRCRTLEEAIPGIPTIVIGWGLLNRLLPEEKLSILNKRVGENLWWTFARMENRSEQEMDCAKFYNSIISSIEERVPYRFFNIIGAESDAIKRFIAYLHSPEPTIAFFDRRRMLYLHRDAKPTIGVSLTDLEFMGVKVERVMRFFGSCGNTKFFFDDKFLPTKLKSITLNKRYLLPYLYSV